MFTAEKFKQDGNVILLLRNPSSEDRTSSVEQRPTRQFSITNVCIACLRFVDMLYPMHIQEAINSTINSPKPTTQNKTAQNIQVEQKEEDVEVEKSKVAEYETIIQGLRVTVSCSI